MKQLQYDAEGAAQCWQMTRKEFFKIHTDFRNKPGRTDVPMANAYCPKYGTVSVQVIFTTEEKLPALA